MDINTPLSAREIEFRPHSTFKTAKGVFSIFLAYKDARVDMKRLDEIYGQFGWQKKYEVINGNLFCSVGVYSKELSQWIWKSDVGVPSNQEAEKGEASDAFKRACFNWGIGRELYEYPTIFVELKEGEHEIKNNKLQPTLKFTKSLRWENAFNEGGELTLLKCYDKNNTIRFNYSNND